VAPPAATSLADALRTVVADLRELGAKGALVGGLAVSARAEPRLTRDIDLAVAVVDDAAAEALVRELGARGYQIGAVIEHARTGRIATVRLVPTRARDIVVDLLFASCGIEPEIVAAAEPLDVIPGLRVPVARVGHLIAMKLLARDDRERPQDADDLRALVAIATAAERRRTERAVRDIMARGYDRRRELDALWREVQAPARPTSLRVRRPKVPTRRRRRIATLSGLDVVRPSRYDRAPCAVVWPRWQPSRCSASRPAPCSKSSQTSWARTSGSRSFIRRTSTRGCSRTTSSPTRSIARMG